MPKNRTKAEVLIKAADVLVVEVNMEKFTGIPGLRHGVHKVQAGHHIMRHFRVNAHHFRVIEGGDKAKHGACRGQINVTAWFIGLGLDREPQFAGIDPYNKRIDRNSEDNVMAVSGAAPPS